MTVFILSNKEKVLTCKLYLRTELQDVLKRKRNLATKNELDFICLFQIPCLTSFCTTKFQCSDGKSKTLLKPLGWINAVSFAKLLPFANVWKSISSNLSHRAWACPIRSACWLRWDAVDRLLQGKVNSLGCLPVDWVRSREARDLDTGARLPMFKPTNSSICLTGQRLCLRPASLWEGSSQSRFTWPSDIRTTIVIESRSERHPSYCDPRWNPSSAS